MADVTTTATTTGSGFSKLDEVVLRIYSKDVQFQAQPLLKFAQFAKLQTDLNANNPGDGITFFKYNNLSKGGKLTEGTPMETQALAGSQTTITVDEWGNAVSVTEALFRKAMTNVLNDAAKSLGYDYGIVADEEARDTLATTANQVFAGTATTKDEITTSDTLSMAEVKDGVETLATNLAPKIGGDHYVCLVHPHQSRGLRDDDDWQTIAETDPQRFYQGQIGRVDDVIFVETTQVDKTNNAAATPVPVYEAIMLGEGAMGRAVGLPVQMRDNGVIDFQRQRELGWYSIFGMGVLNEDNITTVYTA